MTFLTIDTMVVGLPPLEFTECMSDSPYFRENLHQHEKELDNTSQQIKRLIKEVKDLLSAAKRKLFFITVLSCSFFAVKMSCN